MGAASDKDVGIVETDHYPLIIDYLSSGAEFIEGSLGVKGRLKRCVSYKESATPRAPRSVLDVISEGYKLPFIRVPDPCLIRNNRSAELHPALLKKPLSSCWLLIASRSI